MGAQSMYYQPRGKDVASGAGQIEQIAGWQFKNTRRCATWGTAATFSLEIEKSKLYAYARGKRSPKVVLSRTRKASTGPSS
jgi:hypothetical protein